MLMIIYIPVWFYLNDVNEELFVADSLFTFQYGST